MKDVIETNNIKDVKRYGNDLYRVSVQKIKSDRIYSICSCGQSKILPLCDNAHRVYNVNNDTEYKSVKII